MADTLHTIKCPVCQKEMTKVFVPEQGINIDVCLDGCGGIYFDNREFKYFDEPAENIDEILAAKEGRPFQKVDETLPRTCPVCGARMVKNYASIKKEVQVDECYSCGGKFLDHGELIKIRAQYRTEAERSEDVMKYIYSTVGAELKQAQAASEAARRNRSPFKKLFDYMVEH